MVLLKKLLAKVQRLSKVQMVVMLLVIVAGFLRFYKLDISSQFLGDQGRDALIVADIFRKFDIVAIGPTTSVGNIYLGPIYYYFMLPFLFLSYPSPLGPVYAVAALGTIFVFCLYYWGRKMVGETASVFAVIFATFSVIAINLSRFSWNPNPTPLVMLGLIFSSYMAITKSPKYWLGVGFTFAILLQLHYVTLLAGAAAGLIWLWHLITSIKLKKDWKGVVGFGLGALVIVVLSLVPLVLFDLKHGALNAQALSKMFSSSGNFVTASSESGRSPWEILRESHGRGMHILFEFQLGQHRLFNSILLALATIATVNFAFRKKAEHHKGITVVIVYLVVGILGFSAYRNTVFDHYIAFLFPCTFLFIGYCLSKFWQWNSVGKIIAVSALLLFFNYNLPKINFNPSSNTFAQLDAVSDSIHQRVAPGQKYGVVLLSVTKDYHAMNYRYFLSTEREKEALPPSEHGWADLLFIINEEKITETPEKTDIFEITSFNKPSVQERYELPGGPEITVLKSTAASFEN